MKYNTISMINNLFIMYVCALWRCYFRSVRGQSVEVCVSGWMSEHAKEVCECLAAFVCVPTYKCVRLCVSAAVLAVLEAVLQ